MIFPIDKFRLAGTVSRLPETGSTLFQLPDS